MTGEEFEIIVCNWLKDNGYWALLIPRNKSGAQPFDILAIRNSEIYAVDCKVCSEPRLRLSRIEDNQWLAFESIKKKTSATCGFVWYHEGKTGFIDYEDAVKARDLGLNSINLEEYSR